MADLKPTAKDRISNRPTKRRALTPTSAQASEVEALFAKPDRDIQIPSSTDNKSRTLPPPPEIVANVQGSSAGAGSGEFHVYKASRRREYERLRLMDEEVKKEKEDAEFMKNQIEMKAKDEAKTNKNKAKREKAKARKQQSKAKGGENQRSHATEAKGGKMDPPNNSTTAPKNASITASTPTNDTTTDGPATADTETGVVIHDDD
ncbi:MAG: hypothetical protein M1834_009679 [Cirrosporium novae-zelandiae]|nr:MAG: hypothetical protein M1834_009679 [Cirrosporium novae-zelandiae]